MDFNDTKAATIMKTKTKTKTTNAAGLTWL
jgi:hypothetical protein